MRRIGLTGGIAAGKSAVAARLAELGAVVIDADSLARAVVEPGEPALDAIREAFGAEVLTADGRLDRAALGAIVFADRDARRQLEAITHPAIRARAGRLVAEAAERDPDAVVVQDVPLLVEAGPGRYDFDTVLVVEARPETRIARMVELRGMRREDAEARIAAQASDAERRAVADHLIDTDGELARTIEQVDALWPSLRAPLPS